MRYLQIVIGLIVLSRGIASGVALPARLSALHLDSAYAAGQATGMTVVPLALLAGGVLLIVQGWSRRRVAKAERAAS